MSGLDRGFRESRGSGFSRRRLLVLARDAGAALAATGSPVLAAWSPRTPSQPTGPYYLRFGPLSIDNDLLFRPGGTEPAEGQIVYLEGHVRDQSGRAIPDARVEIWQANTHGRYNHPSDDGSRMKPDPNFHGYGHTLTDANGQYGFRTIKPGPYPASPAWTRPPHIHFLVVPPKGGPWTTQMYFKGEPLNDRDLFIARLGGPRQRALVIMETKPAGADAEPGAQRVEFDIVLGQPGVTREPT